MKRNKLGVLLLTTTILLTSILAGCSESSNKPASTNKPTSTPAGQEQGEEAVTTFKLGEEPVNFSYYVHYDWWTTEPWGVNPNSKWVTDNLKVNVTPIQSGGAAEQKLSTMIVSGELPGAIMMDRGQEVERLRSAGVLVPLDDYLDKYPNLKRLAGEETLNMLRSEDGKLYQFPNWYTSAPNGNGGWVVNTKIYKELGEPKLETFDDLYEYLKLVKANYKNVVPLEVGRKASGLDAMFAGFAEDSPVSYAQMKAYPEGNELKSILENDAWVETMVYSNKLFREGLMTQDALTQTNDQVQEKLNSGRVAVIIGTNTTNEGREGNNAWKSIDPDGGYHMIWPIHKEGVDKNKVYPNGYNTLGWNVNVITTSAENPEGIFAYLDWMTGEEGQRIMFFGPQGLYYDEIDEDGSPIPNDAWYNTADDVKDEQKLEAYVWAGNATFVDTAKTKIELALPEDKRNWGVTAQTNVAWKTSKNVTEFNNIDPAPDTDLGIIQKQVADGEAGIITEYVGKILFAKSEADVLALIEQAKKETVQLGYNDALKYRTEKWQENVKRTNAN
ncbi:MAG: extracellular solute-binding protein [Candidatus Pristimantibacillus lignocellulolyticus]|uniref:Extracellular solute-binding protein n=1 Tax=Candidatus Pristimantibacillus lignocellulolyticus TaxID=2994561 RepID=A0A9J6ZL70_9BACL|nr:MAG: extracellular solute-binding protein [Candidatus Pristimantibacillus lignocellulolyticus]